MRQLGRNTERPREPGAFGRWLIAQLRSREMNQRDLAGRIGLHASTVSKWIYGVDVPTIASCDLIADALMVPIEQVLAAAGHPTPIVHPTGNIRREAANLLELIPEPLIVGLIPQLRGLANAAGHEQAMERIRALFRDHEDDEDEEELPAIDPEQSILRPGPRPMGATA